jgi:aspartate carbamoyltransferase catalytic subunit
MIYGKVEDYLPFLESLFDKANSFRYLRYTPYPNLLQGKVMATLFFEPSTRTRLSFESAMIRLGGSVITANDESSSLMKGESISDTIRTVSEYADVIVVRCNKPISEWGLCSCPVINAGDGKNNHPTQALLDTYTINRKHVPRNLKIGISGDMQNSRTINSFYDMLTMDNQIFPYDSAKQTETFLSLKDFEEMLPELHVLYLNRVQRERHENVPENTFVLSEKHLNSMREDAIILNPGPRKEELPDHALNDPRVKFWEQVKNGLYIRMALLSHILKENPK